MKPQRIQRRRTKGWRKPKDAVYVGLGTKWGNPYVYGHRYALTHADGTYLIIQPKNTVEALELYKQVLYGDFHDPLWAWPYKPNVQQIQRELAGKDLMCWCPLDHPCHADVLLEIANRKDQEA